VNGSPDDGSGLSYPKIGEDDSVRSFTYKRGAPVRLKRDFRHPPSGRIFRAGEFLTLSDPSRMDSWVFADETGTTYCFPPDTENAVWAFEEQPWQEPSSTQQQLPRPPVPRRPAHGAHGRKKMQPQMNVRIRIEGLYGLRKNEIMIVEDPHDCDGQIIILSGCWKRFAVPKNDEGVGWEYVDLPPTCINPGNCAKHYGLKLAERSSCGSCVSDGHRASTWTVRLT